MSGETFFVLTGFVIWFIIYTLASGGPAMRMAYAYKIAKGTNQWYMFPMLYLRSFCLEGSQVNGSEEFFPEVNSTIEIHLNLALNGLTEFEVTREFWTEKKQLRVYYHEGFSTKPRGYSFLFEHGSGKVNDNKMILSPNCYRLMKKINKKEEIRKKERERDKKRNISV